MRKQQCFLKIKASIYIYVQKTSENFGISYIVIYIIFSYNERKYSYFFNKNVIN